MRLKLLLHYFPQLSPEQISRFEALGPLYREWNEKINVISRKDIENLYTHHILHALSIAKFTRFKSGSQILDLGTGGGIPGIPLAIYYPEVQFTLIDGTAKKILVVQEIVQSLGLKNVNAIQIRAEELKGKYDFVITRAVAALERLLPWGQRLIATKQKNAFPNGLIALKGGAIEKEIKQLSNKEYVEIAPIKDYFQEEYFVEKSIVYVQL